MYQAVIFDMDGVIVDSESAYLQRRLDYFDCLGKKAEHDQLKDFIGLSNEAVWKKLVSNPLQRDKLKAGYESYQKNHPINYKQYLAKDIKEFLEAIRFQKLKIALASAANSQHITLMLEQCELDKYFDLVISGENVNRNKPFPDIYLETSKSLNISVSNCLVIEDSPNGILAAKSAGMDTWALQPKYYELNQNKADKIFSNFIQMKENLFYIQKVGEYK